MTLTKAQMQLAEKLTDQNGLNYSLMMQNAGVMTYKYIQSKFFAITKKVVILAGNGNNAGDGFVIARLFCENTLLQEGVTLIMCAGEPKTPLAVENFNALNGIDKLTIISLDEGDAAYAALNSAEVIIDCVFGISFHGELSSEVAKILSYANEKSAVRIAIDLPSGVECDSGMTAVGCFNADTTLALAAYKPAHKLALKICGEVLILDIGIPANIIYAVVNYAMKITHKLVSELLPIRKTTANKGDFGKLLNLSGSLTMSGAAMMSTLAAMRVGAGIVRLATTPSVAKMVAPQLMEAMTIPLSEDVYGSISMNAVDEIAKLLDKSTACLVGCGLSRTAGTRKLVEYVLENTKCSVVLDADGLNCLSENVELLKLAKMPTIITPHIGEMARLVDMKISEVIENSINLARVFAKEYNTVVVLKSHKTIIATPSGEIFENTTGNVGLAKGGSGDVLAGMIAGLLTQGLSPRDAALCGVYLHGDCADNLALSMSQYTMLARDVIAEIPFAFKRIGR